MTRMLYCLFMLFCFHFERKINFPIKQWIQTFLCVPSLTWFSRKIFFQKRKKGPTDEMNTSIFLTISLFCFDFPIECMWYLSRTQWIWSEFAIKFLELHWTLWMGYIVQIAIESCYNIYVHFSVWVEFNEFMRKHTLLKIILWASYYGHLKYWKWNVQMWCYSR